MDLKGLRGNDIALDIESDVTTFEDTVRGVKQDKQLHDRVWGGFATADRAVGGEAAGSIGDVFDVRVDMPTEKGEPGKNFGVEGNVGVLGKKMGDERPKRKSKACQKAPKPPRPPTAPSLDAADQKLVREITEFAMLRRARMERVKALKKMKSARASSSKSNFCAMVITILFCFVIVWQGFCSRSHSNVRFEGSPESSVRTRGEVISVQYFRNVSPSTNGSTSASPNIIEPGPGQDFNDQGEMSTAG